LESQDKELHGEEENLHGVLKTAETLVSEAEDKLKKSMIQKDIEQVCYSGDVGGRPSEDDTSQPKLK